MELRKLKALLSALQAAGVTSYRDADLTLTFGAAPMEVPRGDVDTSDVDTSWTAGAPTALVTELERIKKAYANKPGRTS